VVHTQVDSSRPQSDVYPGITAYVTQDEVAAGGKAAELAMQGAPDGGQVAIIEGAAGFAEVANRQKDFRRVLEEQGGGKYEVVAAQPVDWTPEGGQKACENILSANPDIAVFYAQSDDMGVGCAKAVEKAGSNALIVGIGGSKLGIDAIADGTLYGTVCYKPKTMGEFAMQVMEKILAGETVEPYQPYDTPAITKDNVSECEPQW
jgi:ABC-type sugar transport system substrate-binding protein